MDKGGAEATSTSAETRRAGPKSTSIASRVGFSLGDVGGGSRCTDLDGVLRPKPRSDPPPLLVY